MNSEKANLFSNLPDGSKTEIIEKLHEQSGILIERILSNGQTTLEGEWYDQETDEWVLVLRGSGKLLFEGNGEQTLNQGDYLFIPRHKKHRVTFTDLNTIWLAIHISDSK